MKFFTVLVGDDRTGCCAGVCCDLCRSVSMKIMVVILAKETYNYAFVVYATNNGGTGRCGFGKRNSACMQRRIAVVVAEIEARHDRDTRAI